MLHSENPDYLPTNLFSSSSNVVLLAKVFSVLMAKRTTLLEELTTTSSCCRPGASNLDPSSRYNSTFIVVERINIYTYCYCFTLNKLMVDAPNLNV